MKRFLISFFVILITPKLLIADACFENLKFDWKLLGSGKASYNFSNTSKTNNIKVNTISLKDSSSKIIQVHSPMIIVKKNETKSLIFNLTQPFDKYYKGYSRVICETVYFQGDIEKNISTSDFDMNEYSSVNKNLSEDFKNYSSDNKNLTENLFENIYTHEEAKEKYKPKKFGNRKNNNHVIFGIIFFIIICLLGVVRAGITSSKSSNKKTVITPSINTKKENIINNKKVEIITK